MNRGRLYLPRTVSDFLFIGRLIRQERNTSTVEEMTCNPHWRSRVTVHQGKLHCSYCEQAIHHRQLICDECGMPWPQDLSLT